MVKAIVKIVDWTDPYEAAAGNALVMLFYGTMRPGQLLTTQLTPPKKDKARPDCADRKGFWVNLQWQDIKRTQGGSELGLAVVKNLPHSVVHPLSDDKAGILKMARLAHETVNQPASWDVELGLPYISYKDRKYGGGIKPLLQTSFNRFLQKRVRRVVPATILSDMSVKQYLGHSMRIGSTMEMILAGVDDNTICRKGFWKNPQSFERYIRDHVAEGMSDVIGGDENASKNVRRSYSGISREVDQYLRVTTGMSMMDEEV